MENEREGVWERWKVREREYERWRTSEQGESSFR